LRIAGRLVADRWRRSCVSAQDAANCCSRNNVLRLWRSDIGSGLRSTRGRLPAGRHLANRRRRAWGSVAYALADWIVSRQGGNSRKHSGSEQTSAGEGGGLAIAIGSLLDGIPESVVLGLGLLGDQGVSIAMLGAVFLSNFPEGLSSALGMRAAGRSAAYIFGLWSAIALLSGIASMAGAAFLAGASPGIVATVNAVAAGALLTMVVNTMIPEAVQGDRKLTGVLVVVGLLVAFALSNNSGPNH